jgi:NADP-dependent 3-hydroxy acid dehydrogenase YdfG
MKVVITGASKGIGKAIALAFAAEGAELVLCARNEMNLYSTVAVLQSQFPSCNIIAKTVDVSKKDQATAFGKLCMENGPIDILVNNAGQFLPGEIYREEEGILEKMIETNLYSAYHITRNIIPGMIAQKKGHIFNICSIASLQAYTNGGSYSISKFALMGFSKNLREELKPHHIKVTAVYPGAVLTDSWGNFDNSDNRIMEADDIAKLIIASSKLSASAVVEDIVIRPQLGDL